MYEGGQFRGFAKITRDLTQRKQAEVAAQHVALIEQRERIALDVRDEIISGLFRVGMSLQSLATSVRDDPDRGKLEAAVADIDTAIRALRNYIFGAEALSSQAHGHSRRPGNHQQA